MNQLHKAFLQLPDGVKLYSKQSYNKLLEVAQIVAFESGMAPLCSKRPMVCPDGLREASFLIDLKNSNVSHDDLSNDLYDGGGQVDQKPTSLFVTIGV